MKLTSGVVFSPTQTITRQELYDMWATASIGSMVAADVGSGTLSLATASNLSEYSANPTPGQIVYDRTQRLWFIYADQIDYTGVSLWLAMGPDCFDDAFLATEPIPPGALVSLDETKTGRHMRLARGLTDRRTLGFVACWDTAASGAWCCVRTMGFAWAWIYADTNTGTSDFLNTNWARGLYWQSDIHVPGSLLISAAAATKGDKQAYLCHPGNGRSTATGTTDSVWEVRNITPGNHPNFWQLVYRPGPVRTINDRTL